MSSPPYFRLMGLLLMAAVGCSHLRLPAIDPSGQRIFSGGSTTLAGPDCPLFTRPAVATTAPAVVAGPVVKPPCTPPVVAQPVVAVPVVPVVAVPIVAVPVAPIQQPACGPQGCPNGPQLKVCPAQLVAPVGSEVVVTAGLCGPSGYYLTRQPLEWMLAPDGVGQIVQVGKETDNSFASYFRGTPNKVGPNYVRAHTSTTRQIIDRGTPSPLDDLALEKGQSWISVTSPTEGTTNITVWAPAEGNWEKRRQTATILWVDAKWKYPAPAIVRSGAGGRHILTTKITRGNGTPIDNFLVEYEVLEGPEADFGAAGQKKFPNVPHTGEGNYSAELVSKSGQAGVTTVMVRIYRPEKSRKLLVGQGLTSVTWSSPGLHVQATGPEVIPLGGTVNYQVKVYNSGDVAARDVKLSFTPPSGVTFLNATPSPGAFGQMLQWRLGDLQPGTSTVVDLNCRSSIASDIRAKFRVESAEKLTAESNVNTKVFASALSVKSSSPARVEVGQEVQFKVEVTNTGRTPLTNVTVTDSFDPGLTHKQGEASPMVKLLGTLAPNQTSQFSATFRVDQPGKLCHRLEVMADGGHSAATTGCVEAVPPAAAVASPKVSVLVVAPPKLEVGKKAIVKIEIKNGSLAALTNLRLTASFPKSLVPLRDSDGAPFDDEGLHYLIPRMMAGETVVKQIEFEGAKADPAAHIKARLTSDQAAVQTSEATINVATPAITPPRNPGSGIPGAAIEPPANAGNLKVSVAALNEPIGLNMQVTYRINLKNESTQPDDDVAITLILQDGLKFKSLTPADKYRVIS